MSDYIKETYTADDEEPKCGRCDYLWMEHMYIIQS